MLSYLTEEQSNLMTEVHDNHEEEFKQWALENKTELLKWYDLNDYKSMAIMESVVIFAHHCCTLFMDWKTGVKAGA